MVRIALVGILGFGGVHLRSIRDCEKNGLCILDSLVIVDMKNSRKALEELLSEKPDLKVYSSLEALIEAKSAVDLICLPTGIASHKPLSEMALRAGYNVLCEKPAAGTLEDALSMAAVQKESGKMLAIGYQNLFSSSIQKIKSITLSGRMGALKEARTIVGWPRDKGYYGRNDWAGRILAGGNFIFDSPLQNAAAHFLQNMLYVAGASSHDCCEVREVYGENYRVNDISSSDTQFIRVIAGSGARLNMAVSHGIDEEIDPKTIYLFEDGKIIWSDDDGKTLVFDSEDRLVESFDNGQVDRHLLTMEETVRVLAEGQVSPSDIHNALAHARCLDAQYRCMNPIVSIDDAFTATIDSYGSDGDDLCYIKDLGKALNECFNTGKSFYEMNLRWAAQGEKLWVSG